MALERRRNGRLYYYRVRRDGKRIIKEYVGGGDAGRLAAEADQAARQARRQAAELRAEQDRPVIELAELIDEFETRVDMVVGCQLLAAGWRQHHREWRTTNGRRRIQKH